MAKLPYKFLSSLRTESETLRELLAEFMGTFMLMVIGNGAVAFLVISNGLSSTFATGFCYGIGALVGISLSLNISGGHINPAVTVAMATIGKFPWRKVLLYFLGQYLGAFIASAVVYVTYYEGFDDFDGGHRVAWDPQRLGLNATGAIFATYPAHYISLFGAFMDQVIGTALLLISVCAVTDERGLNVPKYLQPLILAFIICTLVVAYGINCGAILNPARDIAPRLFTMIYGWGVDPFKPLNGHYWYVAGLIGPHLGAIIGVWIYYLTIELHHPDLGHDESVYTLSAVSANKPTTPGKGGRGEDATSLNSDQNCNKATSVNIKL